MVATRLVERTSASTPRGTHALVAARAVVAEAVGDPEGATPLYRDAAARWEDFGHVVERAFALLGAGRCLVAVGDRTAATDPLSSARDTFSRLGAGPLVAEADRLLG